MPTQAANHRKPGVPITDCQLPIGTSYLRPLSYVRFWHKVDIAMEGRRARASHSVSTNLSDTAIDIPTAFSAGRTASIALSSRERAVSQDEQLLVPVAVLISTPRN
jgi:hypothetical protein